MGDGKFGAAYAQEDGVAFKEESTGNNERIGEINVDIKKEEWWIIFIPGQYSYLDENGNTIVVKYSAGVNGFRWGILFYLICTLLKLDRNRKIFIWFGISWMIWH